MYLRHANVSTPSFANSSLWTATFNSPEILLHWNCWPQYFTLCIQSFADSFIVKWLLQWLPTEYSLFLRMSEALWEMFALFFSHIGTSENHWKDIWWWQLALGSTWLKLWALKVYPLLLKCQRNSWLTVCVCTKFSMPLTFQYFSVNHSFVFWWLRGRSDSRALLHLDDEVEINLGCVFRKRNYLKDTVSIVITDELLWNVNDSIVSYVFRVDAFFPIFVHGASISHAKDSLYR